MRNIALLALLFVGCTKDKPSGFKPVDEPVEPTTQQQPTPQQQRPPMAAEPTLDEVSGTVVETMNASEYTYALLERDGKKVWVAGPQTKLAVGQAVAPVKGSPMPGFHSETLNRTFDQIYFIPSFGAPSAAPPAMGSAAGSNPHTNPQPVAQIEKVDPAPGGTTVGKIFEDKAKLAGKAIVVRGKVMKVNNGILDRNWVHLQDGTGAAGTNDLMVTTAATATVGEIVVVRGTVAIDKDFGGGYSYAVIVENATLAAK